MAEVKLKRDSIAGDPFSDALMLPPIGFENCGAVCYWNALLNSLMSCTAFTQCLITHKAPEYTSNPVIQKFVALYEDIKNTEPNSFFNSLPEIKDGASIQQIEERIKAVSYRAGLEIKFLKHSTDIWHATQKMRLERELPMLELGQQQDAGEMFTYIFDILDKCSELMELVTTVLQDDIYCHICQKFAMRKEEPVLTIMAVPSLRNEQIEALSKIDKSPDEPATLVNYIKKQKTYVRWYRCPKCGQDDDKLRIYRLKYLPTILFVFSMNFSKNVTLNYPPEMKFPQGSDDDKKRFSLFKPVAQIEHSGSAAGGHYIAICKRAPIDGYHPTNWWRLDDSRVSQTSNEFAPTADTYCAVYHYYGCVEE